MTENHVTVIVRAALTAARRFAIVAAVWALGGAMTAAEGATFTVDPTQIHLSAGTGSVLLKLRNESTGTLRFQLSVFKWTQSASGEMVLEPTQDIVFFPSLLTLAPAEERRIRVGSATTFDASEKTYRIFVEELPPLAGDTASNGVRVLTKMGIPIFLRPAKAMAAAALTNLRREDGQFKFDLANSGTVHFVPQHVRVRAFAGANPVFEQALDSWYVLSGGRRDFATELPVAGCAAVTSLLVEVEFNSTPLVERLQTPGGVCQQ